MKIFKHQLLIGICLGICFLSACDDNTSLVGGGLMPEEDRITVYSDTFLISASTVKRDSLFSKSTTGLLGEYYDPQFGRLKADYLCQFYCEDEFKFQGTPYNNSIDSIYLSLIYTESGDPNTPIQFQVFPVTRLLDKAYYTNVNADEYADLNTKWGEQVYTASSGTIVDSIQISATEYEYYKQLIIKLPIELGQRIYEETLNNPASFMNQQAFNEFFPGIYMTTGYGSGCLFNVYQTDIFINYKYVLLDTKGRDSTLYMTEQFTTTKEVVQLNRFENSDTEQLLAENDDNTFIKTPAGIYTRLVIPSRDIKPVIQDRIINSMMFSLQYLPNNEWPFSLKQPTHLLLLPEDSLSNFFMNRSVDNNITIFVSVDSPAGNSTSTQTGFSADTRTYYFNNIATILAYHFSVAPDDDLRLVVIPVNRKTSSNSFGLYSSEISNFLAPSGLKLRKDKDFMKIAISTSIYHNK
ncbi:MAG: DUF4270 domain-containing protein [Tannerella sp.]|jgi:hypothetical protein|nr:DUF4270 domain-containing protein [Tannerella sp.]